MREGKLFWDVTAAKEVSNTRSVGQKSDALSVIPTS